MLWLLENIIRIRKVELLLESFVLPNLKAFKDPRLTCLILKIYLKSQIPIICVGSFEYNLHCHPLMTLVDYQKTLEIEEFYEKNRHLMDSNLKLNKMNVVHELVPTYYA